jgi:galactokinase/mevalonate kinase-like predicted kinase
LNVSGINALLKIIESDMREDAVSNQFLLSLPSAMARDFAVLEKRQPPEWFATADPPGRKLGSGGGAAHLLVEAWRATGQPPRQSFSDWLRSSRKLIIHCGGPGRRLPAYAPLGKLLMPVPVIRWVRGQRIDQTLLDIQVREYRRILDHASSPAPVLIASGEVLLRFGRELPVFPEVDVLGLGMWVTPEVAQHYGVFFCPRQQPNELAFFLQKPSAARLRELSADYLYLVDSGMWLLSERATQVLLRHCGWDSEREVFTGDTAKPYELYSHFGLALGRNPSLGEAEINALSSAVVPLPQAEFYPFGASRQMIESISQLQNLELDETKLGLMGGKRHPDQYLQNSHFEYPLRREENHTLWVENSHIPASWKLAFDHVLTGVPYNQWDLRLEAGVCLDFVPIEEDLWCIRSYAINDTFQGTSGDAQTLWLDRSMADWFAARGLSLASAGIEPGMDIQDAPLFPVLATPEMDPRFIEWLFSAHPDLQPRMAERWRKTRRLSAQQILAQVNLRRLYQQRENNRQNCLLPMLRNSRWSVFYKLDLESTARVYAATACELPEVSSGSDHGMEPMQRVRDQMFRAAVMRQRGQPDWQSHEQEAFAYLRQMIVKDAQLAPVAPRCSVQEDQIVWARSPVRLDLAGGWSDTPPYCLEHGGRVVNLAVDLNGQPPIQVFAKLSEKPELVIRSIDLGAETRLRSYAALETYAEPGSEFALAKAAFALVGFLPRFQVSGGFSTLEDQLRNFGGGIELSLLSAVPKGSGLGTSSILASTVLAALGDLCGLKWDRQVLFTRTLALEQMLTTGGGWQDQAGGIYRGLKMIETQPGLAQKPTLRWLPDHLFSNDHANRTILLYYTGLTRLAKSILHEIVRGIFLNSPAHLQIVEEIAANAEVAFHAAQQVDYAGLTAAVRQSWRLNQRLDRGTNPPEVQFILTAVQDYLEATKLLGAGGGGYLLMFAKDADAALRIRRILLENPPNAKARFVSMQVSDTGLQVTRS